MFASRSNKQRSLLLAHFIAITASRCLLQTDEERFEDDPEEFIVRDIEGEDSESRRRNSQDLLRAMCRQFEPQTTSICTEHIGSMLAEYAADPSNKWVAKDVAVSTV